MSTLKAIYDFFTDLRLMTWAGLVPTVKQIFRTPSLLLHPTALSQFFMTQIWIVYGDDVDKGSRSTKERLITPNAHGVVLDLGAGFGHSVPYLDAGRVTRYVALEPNKKMHARIRRTANAHGFSETSQTLLILPFGAQDTTQILTALENTQVDCIISILTLCTIPNPQKTLFGLVNEILKPGGSLLYSEHVLNDREDMAWWGRLLAPIWQIPLDGCRIDRPTHKWIADVKDADGESAWVEGDVWGNDDEDTATLFWRRIGKYVKKH